MAGRTGRIACSCHSCQLLRGRVVDPRSSVSLPAAMACGEHRLPCRSPMDILSSGRSPEHSRTLCECSAGRTLYSARPRRRKHWHGPSPGHDVELARSRHSPGSVPSARRPVEARHDPPHRVAGGCNPAHGTAGEPVSPSSRRAQRIALRRRAAEPVANRTTLDRSERSRIPPCPFRTGLRSSPSRSVPDARRPSCGASLGTESPASGGSAEGCCRSCTSSLDGGCGGDGRPQSHALVLGFSSVRRGSGREGQSAGEGPVGHMAVPVSLRRAHDRPCLDGNRHSDAPK